MIVERLRTHRFRHLSALDLTLGPGLTIIRGPNEVGKSSVVAALLTVLFARANTNAKEVVDQKDWDGGDCFKIEIAFRCDDRRFGLVKDFAAHTQTLREFAPNQTADDAAPVVKDAREIERRLTELLGCPSRQFFESTACIKHGEVARINQDRQFLPERLQRLVTGPDDANVTTALGDLGSYLVKLNRGLTRAVQNPGLVLQARLEVQALRAECQSLEASRQKRQGWQSELQTVRGEQASNSDELKRLRQQQADNVGAVDHAREVRRLTSRLETLERAERLKKAHDEAGKALGPLALVDDVSDQAATVQRILGQIDGLKALPPARAPAASSPITSAMLPAGVVLVAVGIVLAALLNPAALVLAALGLACLVAAAVLPRARQPAPDAANATIDDLRRKANAAASKLGFASPPAFLAAFDVYRKRQEDCQSLANRLGQAIGREPTADGFAQFLIDFDGVGTDLIAQRQALGAVETAELLPEVRAYAFAAVTTPDDLPARQVLRRLDEQIDTLKQKIAGQETRATELGALLSQPGPTQEDLDSRDERLAAAIERQTVWERRLAAVEQAISTISEAKDAVMTSVADQIQPAIGERLARVTGGRYSDVRVNSSDLSVTVALPGTGRFVSSDQLSHGTRDQIYLAARLALVHHMCDGRQPPFIVDDALASFDDERARRMLELLRDFARGRQVLLFTWSDRYDAQADHVIDLLATGQALAPVG